MGSLDLPTIRLSERLNPIHQLAEVGVGCFVCEDGNQFAFPFAPMCKVSDEFVYHLVRDGFQSGNAEDSTRAIAFETLKNVKEIMAKAYTGDSIFLFLLTICQKQEEHFWIIFLHYRILEMEMPGDIYWEIL